jgi:CubicO group peptidase (beta-lactamase class C family)
MRTATLSVVLALLLTCACVSCGRPPAGGDADALVGIWSAEASFGPAVHGDITIDGRRDPWRAVIGDVTVPVSRNMLPIEFRLPGGAGEYRGSETRGQWIQPQGVVHFSSYATPVDLRPSGPSTWTGRLTPLDDHVTFYVLVRRTSNGSQRAYIHNPEFNWLSRTEYRVDVQGDAVALTSSNGALRGRYDRQRDTLTLPLLDVSPPVPPLHLKRCRERDAVGLMPRAAAGSASYAYHQPTAREDGWATATLVEVGIDEKRITALMQKIMSTDPADLHAMAIHSILIARHGKLALEEYFYGTSADQPHDMRSAGKTWAPMWLGVVRDRGSRVEPTSRVLSVFFRYPPPANPDDRKSRMTVADLMTMTSGLECDDNDDASPGNEDRMQSQRVQPDWYKYTLDLPMAREPGGEHAIYCSAGLNLVGGVAAGHGLLPELFAAYIARPLQFGLYHLNLMPTGEVYMGGGAYIRPRDQLKLGQVYLAGGVWNGRYVIDPEWVTASTTRHSSFKPVIDIDVDHAYGYGWHLHHFTVNGHEYREYAAEGNGGQMVMVVPDLDMVVAISAGNYGDPAWYRWALKILPDYLIPAAAGGTPTGPRP